jgi:hypothetical protein
MTLDLARLPLVLGLLASVGCAYETTATANRVPVPVLVGPVERIGGGAEQSEDGPEFDVKVDRRFTASSSTQNYGSYSVTTTTTSHTQDGAGKVDAQIRRASDGKIDRLVRIDQVKVNAYSGFFYSAAWISSRVRVKGHWSRRTPAPRPLTAPALAPAPTPSTPEAAPAAPAEATPPVTTPAMPTQAVRNPF